MTPATPFGGLDLIAVGFTSLPAGTFVLGYATPSLAVTDTPFAEAGVGGIAAAVPEPGTPAILGTALAALGALRRRRTG